MALLDNTSDVTLQLREKTLDGRPCQIVIPMMGLPQLVQIISKILKTVRDDYICRASPSEMIYSFKKMSKHIKLFCVVGGFGPRGIIHHAV